VVKIELDTGYKITWCPGCTNFGILAAFKNALQQLFDEGKLSPEKVVVVGGIGCHGNIINYINVNSFGALHGRALPVLQGIALANPDLKPIGFVGDGDLLDEGIEHFIHAARRNANITVIMHDNHNFALTTSQRTATSPKGFRGKSTPKGSPEEPLNPDVLALTSGATFVARTFARNIPHMTRVFREAILHRGFSFVHVLQPCVTWFDTSRYYQSATYEVTDNNPEDFQQALSLAKQFYVDPQLSLPPKEKIPIGVFYKVEKPSYSDAFTWIAGKRLAGDYSQPRLREIIEERWL